MPTQTITYEQLASLGAESLEHIYAYERSILKHIKDWNKNYHKLSQPKINEISHKICSNWANIIEYLGLLERELADH